MSCHDDAAQAASYRNAAGADPAPVYHVIALPSSLPFHVFPAFEKHDFSTILAADDWDGEMDLAIMRHCMETSPGRQAIKMLVTSGIPRWLLKRLAEQRLSRCTGLASIYVGNLNN